MKEKTAYYNVTMDSHWELCVNGTSIGHHMLDENYEVKCRIINAAVDKVGLDRVKECMVWEFEDVNNYPLYNMLNYLCHNEKRLSKYMNVSRGMVDRICEKDNRLAKHFLASEQLKQLKTKMIDDIEKCKTRNQMLKLFQKDLERHIVIVFLKYCFLEENWVRA